MKYADLSKNRTSDYVFDWDAMMSFDGNTAPYLQYAYARVMSLFARGGIDPKSVTGPLAVNAREEHLLALQLARFQETLEPGREQRHAPSLVHVPLRVGIRVHALLRELPGARQRRRGQPAAVVVRARRRR